LEAGVRVQGARPEVEDDGEVPEEGASVTETADKPAARQTAAPPTKKWSLRRYLVAGVLVWLPILATIWVVTFIVHLMDRTLVLLPPAYRPQALVGYALPGVGALFAVL